MTTANTGNTVSPLVVRFARRSARGVLLGFSAPRVVALGSAVAVAVAAVFIGGATAFAFAGIIWIPVAVSAIIRVEGRPVVEWAGTAAGFAARRTTAQTEYRARPGRPRPAGTLALPGDAASLRLHVDTVSGAAMIHDPHRQSLTAVAAITHPAFALLDDADRAARVGRWGRVLAGLAASGTCAAVQVLEATVPDPAAGLHEWWESHGSGRDGWAEREYQALLERVTLGSSTHRSTISLALNLRAAARAIRAAGGGVRGAAEVLRGDMASVGDSLRLAGIRPSGWLTEAQLAVIVRDVFDPAEALDPRTAPDGNMAHAGPMAVSETWERMRHDAAWSQVLWISEWPRIAVPADFLHPLVFAPGVRRSLSLIARPLPTDTALRQLRRDKTAAVADSAQKTRIGQLADLSDVQEYDDLVARERSIISGHADVEYTGLVAVTAPSRDALDAAVATIGRAACQACCELRTVYGHQMQAFIAAALPLARTTF
jgi:hypothetical protein